MPIPVLATKLYIPPPRPELVSRPRLVEGLNRGLHHKLTLISAPAGFGKTTLAGEWVASGRRPAAWLSLDEGDSDPARFLAYLVAALEARTEGWIAGLQLAALSMQARADTAGFIKAFSGSHRFVLDYLLEEVLHQQPADVQAFLLRTSVLNRMCGPLCDAVLGDSTASGQGHLGPQWASWFGGLTITLEGDGITLLTGPVVDQAALYGVLKKVRDLGLPLLAVNCVEPAKGDPACEVDEAWRLR